MESDLSLKSLNEKKDILSHYYKYKYKLKSGSLPNFIIPVDPPKDNVIEMTIEYKLLKKHLALENKLYVNYKI